MSFETTVARAQSLGAVEMRAKVIDDAGKYRTRCAIDVAVEDLEYFRASGADVEAWFIDADGEFVKDADGYVELFF